MSTKRKTLQKNISIIKEQWQLEITTKILTLNNINRNIK